MEISCDIIRDILPLYAEDMVSVATRALVDDHLCGCDGCVKELAVLKKGPKLPVDLEVGSLKRVSATIRKRRVLTVLCVLMTIFCILVTGLRMCGGTQIYLPYDQAIESVEHREDGALVIDFSRAVVGTSSIMDGDNEVMCCNTTVYDYLSGKLLDWKLSGMTQEEVDAYILDAMDIEALFGRREITEEDRNRFFGISTEYCFRDETGNRYISEGKELPEGWKEMQKDKDAVYTLTDFDYNLMYMNRNGTGGVVMHQGGKEAPNRDLYKRYGEGGYLWEEAFYVSAILAAGLWILLWKKKSLPEREWIVTAAMVFTAVAGGILAASFGQFNYTGEHLSFSWMESTLEISGTSFASALLWRRLYLLNRNDRGL